MQTLTAQHSTSSSAQPYRRRACTDSGYVMDPLSLAHLNFGLFGTLCKLGTSQERICSALNISYRDFDYLQELTSTQRQKLSGGG
ncbi:MAG: hypothetical protein V7696_18065 [Halioglobus sp.]